MRRRRERPAPETSIPASILAHRSISVGRLESEEDLILAGSFEGQLRSARSVQLLTGSQVRGDVHATEIIVQGRVTGNLLARERIKILEGGDVNGEVCAPQVTVQEGVALNARVRMSSHSEETRDYLLPVLLRTESGAAPRQWVALLEACEEFLEACGFVVETRARPATRMRSIFRSREPLSWAQFRTALERIAAALHPGGTDTPQDPETLARQGAAQHLVEALGDAPEAVAVVGISVVRPAAVDDADEASSPEGRRQDGSDAGSPGDDETPDGRHRPEFLPVDSEGGLPSPADVLLEMQRIQGQVLGEAARTPSPGA